MRPFHSPRDFLLLISGVLGVALVACQTVDPGQSLPQSVGRGDLQAINAATTSQVGVYRVGVLMRELSEVRIASNEDPANQRFVEERDWSYDSCSGHLTLRRSVDPDAEMVIAFGRRQVPWGWVLGPDVDDGSIRLVLGDREAVRGVDFEVGPERGVVRMMRVEDCSPDVAYYLTFLKHADPQRPTQVVRGSIGNHPDPDRLQAFVDR